MALVACPVIKLLKIHFVKERLNKWLMLTSQRKDDGEIFEFRSNVSILILGRFIFVAIFRCEYTYSNIFVFLEEIIFTVAVLSSASL